MNKTRICSKCGQEKPLDAEHFYKHPQCRGGHKNTCISCYQKKNGMRVVSKNQNLQQSSFIKVKINGEEIEAF